MRFPSVLQRSALLGFLGLFATGASGCLGCAGATESDEGDVLRARFPEQASGVLEGHRAFVAGERGFVSSYPVAPNVRPLQGFHAILPSRGDGEVRFEMSPRGGLESGAAAGAFEVRVRELGAAGRGHIVDDAVAYRSEGSTRYWTVKPDSLEEWIHFEAGAAASDRPVASWTIEGATLRQRGSIVELADAMGTARLRVTAPRAYTASGRVLYPRLSTDGARLDLWVDAAGEEVLVDPAWTATSSLNQGRTAPVGVQLNDDRFLVTGGEIDALPAAADSAEIYDPVTDAWVATVPMNEKRTEAAGARLGDGRVLVVGGTNGTDVLASAEVYAPGLDTWTAVAPMSVGRLGARAVALPNGTVLVAGGFAVADLASAEVYDAVADTWTPAGAMSSARFGHTLTLLQDGTVLMAGGYGGSPQQDSQIYDPVTNTWGTPSPMNAPKVDHGAALLVNGNVLTTNGDTAGAEIYDPTTAVWTSTSAGINPHGGGTTLRLSNGKVLAAGGSSAAGSTSAEIYDPTANTWTATTGLAAPRRHFAAILLQTTGEVLIAGGDDGAGTIYASAELFALDGNGVACATELDCFTGNCVDGVCCDSPCGAGACDACSVAAGGAIDGTCALLTGPACTDGVACTQMDTCQVGLCVGTPVVCAPSDSCHEAGSCGLLTGECTDPMKPDGDSCTDDDACTTTDACLAGVCISGPKQTCVPPGPCQEALGCDAMTGACMFGDKSAGSDCDDGTPCTKQDSCIAGVCTGTVALCAPKNACHEQGACDAATGVCSDPILPDGVPCTGGVCEAGECKSAGTTTATSGSGGGGAGGDATGAGGSGGAGTGGGAPADTTTTGGGGSAEDAGGCGCGVAGTRVPGAMWTGLLVLLALRRRPARARS